MAWEPNASLTSGTGNNVGNDPQINPPGHAAIVLADYSVGACLPAFSCSRQPALKVRQSLDFLCMESTPEFDVCV